MKSLNGWYGCEITVTVASSLMLLLHCLMYHVIFQEDTKEDWRHLSFYSAFSFCWTQVRIQNFFFFHPYWQTKENWWRKTFSLLDQLEDECRETDSSTLASQGDREIECGCDSDWGSSDDTLDKFAQTQESARGLCFCGIWKRDVHSLLVTHSTGRTFTTQYFPRTEPSCFDFLKIFVWQISCIWCLATRIFLPLNIYKITGSCRRRCVY